MRVGLLLVFLASLVAGCAGHGGSPMAADTPITLPEHVTPFGFVGLHPGELFLLPDHSFIRVDEIPAPTATEPDNATTRPSTGVWEPLAAGVPVVELRPGGLYFVAMHDAATSATPVVLRRTVPPLDEQVLYLKTPQGYLFLPRLAAFPGDLPAHHMAAVLQGYKEGDTLPPNPPLYKFLIDKLQHQAHEVAATQMQEAIAPPAAIGDAVLIGCWTGDDTHFWDKYDATKPENIPHTDLLVLRTGPALTAAEVAAARKAPEQPTRRYFTVGAAIYPVTVGEWHRPGPLQPDNRAAFAMIKALVLGALSARP